MIIDKTFDVYDYTDYHNCISKGMFAFPFTLHLPDWLPQSHLCYDTNEDSKKPQGKDGKYGKVNILKTYYDLKVHVLSST